MGSDITVLHRLVNELEIKPLKSCDQYKLLSTKYKRFTHHTLNYHSIKINIDHEEKNNSCFVNTEYKLVGNDITSKKTDDIIFRFDDEIVLENNKNKLHKSYKILVKNEALLHIKEYIQLQIIVTPEIDISAPMFCDHLKMAYTGIVTLTNATTIEKTYQEKILKYKYAVINDNLQQKLQMKPQEMINSADYIYEFNNINDIRFLIPFSPDFVSLNVQSRLYIQPEKEFDYVMVKKFYPKTASKIEYFLNILQHYPSKIISPVDFFKQIGFQFNDLWIPYIRNKLIKSNNKQTTTLLLHRFIDELNINEFPNLCLNHYEDGFTLKQLVLILTHEAVQREDKWVAALLLCHVLFTKSIELVKLFITMFVDSEKQKESHTKSHYKSLRILSVWIMMFWEQDFEKSSQILMQLKPFFESINKYNDVQRQTAMKQLQEMYNAQQNKHKNRHINDNETESKHSSDTNVNIINQKASNLAEQFTLMHFKAFQAIHPRECLEKAGIVQCNQHLAVNLSNMIKLCNGTVKWVQILILNQPNLNKRAKVLKLCILITSFMYNYRNYSGCCAFIKALESIPIYRLRKCWNKLSSSDVKKFKEMQNLFGATCDLTVLRKLQKTAESPAISSIDLILKDVITIHKEQNNNVQNGNINLKKMLTLYEAVNYITSNQQQEYEFKENLELQSAISSYFIQNQNIENTTLLQKSYSVQLIDRDKNPNRQICSLLTIQIQFHGVMNISRNKNYEKQLRSYFNTTSVKNMRRVEVLDVDIGANQRIATIILFATAKIKSADFQSDVLREFRQKLTGRNFKKYVSELFSQSTSQPPIILIYGPLSSTILSPHAKSKTSGFNVLLLGPGDSGRSEIFAAIEKLYQDDDDMQKIKEDICRSILLDIHDLCNYNKALNTVQTDNEYKLSSLELNDICDQIQSWPRHAIVEQPSLILTNALAIDINQLWNDRAMKLTFSKRQHTHIMNNTAYFLDKILEIVNKENDYNPSFDDMCRIRDQKTLNTGFGQKRVLAQTKMFGECQLTITNIGGQRSERKKWINMMKDDFDMIWFIIDISEFDVMCWEDMNTLRLQEALNLFENMVTAGLMNNKTTTIIFNKHDLLLEKLNDYSTFSPKHYFEDFPSKKDDRDPNVFCQWVYG
eukprot:540859_1